MDKRIFVVLFCVLLCSCTVALGYKWKHRYDPPSKTIMKCISYHQEKQDNITISPVPKGIPMGNGLYYSSDEEVNVCDKEIEIENPAYMKWFNSYKRSKYESQKRKKHVH